MLNMCSAKANLFYLTSVIKLTVASTHALMCLGAWSRLGLGENDDIKAVASLPDVVDDDDNMNVE